MDVKNLYGTINDNKNMHFLRVYDSAVKTLLEPLFFKILTRPILKMNLNFSKMQKSQCWMLNPAGTGYGLGKS